jgi:hypothetical protein
MDGRNGHSASRCELSDRHLPVSRVRFRVLFHFPLDLNLTSGITLTFDTFQDNPTSGKNQEADARDFSDWSDWHSGKGSSGATAGSRAARARDDALSCQGQI